MAPRFTYSRWDGTQQGFDLDAMSLIDELADDLLANGDVNEALQRLLRDGMRDRNGERVQGLREMLERLRRERNERLDRFDLGGVYQEISDALADILDEERHAIDRAVAEAERSGDERRANAARESASERNLRLDLLPDDLAGKVKDLSDYSFESAEAQRRFDELIDKLRQQLMQQAVDRMSSAMKNMTPADMQRATEMMAALNDVLERYERGDDPRFEEFMQQYGDFFPENPQSVEELLELLARRQLAMQQMLNSMTPEQRQQLQQLSEQLLGDVGLQWEMDRLGRNLQAMMPQLGWDESRNFQGDEQVGMEQAMQTMQELGQLDRLEQLLRNASSPAQLAEADLDRVRDLLGDDAARSLERLAEFTRMLEESGLVRNHDGRLELTPKGLRRIGDHALRDLFAKLEKDQAGRHRIEQVGHGHERSYDTKPYEYGDPFHLDLQRTIRNAVGRQGAGVPVRLSPDDFEVERTEHLTRSSTVLMIDLSMSMVMRDNLLPAKKVALALHSLISSQFPRDFLGLIGFSLTAYELKASELPTVSCDWAQGTNMQHGLALARKMLSSRSGSKQVIMITDGEPTAHVWPNGQPWFSYPPRPETVEATLREVLRCTRDGIRINTFMLDADYGLQAFVERMTEMNRGRAFFTNHDNLGDYVLVDFIEQKRRAAGGRRRSA